MHTIHSYNEILITAKRNRSQELLLNKKDQDTESYTV